MVSRLSSYKSPGRKALSTVPRLINRDFVANQGINHAARRKAAATFKWTAPAKEEGETQSSYHDRCWDLRTEAFKLWHDARRRATFGPNCWWVS